MSVILLDTGKAQRACHSIQEKAGIVPQSLDTADKPRYVGIVKNQRILKTKCRGGE